MRTPVKIDKAIILCDGRPLVIRKGTYGALRRRFFQKNPDSDLKIAKEISSKQSRSDEEQNSKK